MFLLPCRATARACKARPPAGRVSPQGCTHSEQYPHYRSYQNRKFEPRLATAGRAALYWRERPQLFHIRKMLADRRGSTSFDYARVAAAVSLVLFEVMQAPALFIVMHAPAKALGMLIMDLLAGLGSHVSAS